jgi:hypothetical protein
MIAAIQAVPGVNALFTGRFLPGHHALSGAAKE